MLDFYGMAGSSGGGSGYGFSAGMDKEKKNDGSIGEKVCPCPMTPR